MSVPTCPEVRELAPELALGIVGGPERAEALQHASECGPCRALVGELAEAADALTLLAAEAEPPPGFEERVLAEFRWREEGLFQKHVDPERLAALINSLARDCRTIAPGPIVGRKTRR